MTKQCVGFETEAVTKGYYRQAKATGKISKIEEYKESRVSEMEQNETIANPQQRLWNRNYIKVMISNFLLFFAFFLLTPLLPIYLDAEFDADKDVIGVVLSGYVVATFLIRPFSGYFVDTFSRKKVLVICFFAFFIFFTGYIGAGTILMFGIVRTLHGMPFGAVTVANSTVAIDVLPSERRNEGIGFYGLSNNLAMAIAPSAGIYIYSAYHDFSLLFWLSLVLSFVGFLCSCTVKLPYREKVANKPKLDLDHFFLGRAWMMAINICLFALCWGIMGNYVAIYGQEELGITDGTGIFYAILAAGLVASRFMGRKALRAGKLTRSCAIGVCFSLAGYMLFALAINEWTFYASALLIGLGNGRMYPAFLNMFINVARHDQRGTANSSILISWDLGMGIGLLLGGVLAEYFGFATSFWLAALMQLAGTLLFLTVTRRFYLKRALTTN